MAGLPGPNPDTRSAPRGPLLGRASPVPLGIGIISPPVCPRALVGRGGVIHKGIPSHGPGRCGGKGDAESWCVGLGSTPCNFLSPAQGWVEDRLRRQCSHSPAPGILLDRMHLDLLIQCASVVSGKVGLFGATRKNSKQTGGSVSEGGPEGGGSGPGPSSASPSLLRWS